jgi:hypothetical protein
MLSPNVIGWIIFLAAVVIFLAIVAAAVYQVV